MLSTYYPKNMHWKNPSYEHFAFNGKLGDQRPPWGTPVTGLRQMVAARVLYQQFSVW